MVSRTVDPPQLTEAKRIIAETIARLSEEELLAFAARIKRASVQALFGSVEGKKL